MTDLTRVRLLLLRGVAGFLDWVPKKMQRVGCMELLNTVQRRVQPKLHIFGHIHEGTDLPGTPGGAWPVYIINRQPSAF